MNTAMTPRMIQHYQDGAALLDMAQHWLDEYHASSEWVQAMLQVRAAQVETMKAKLEQELPFSDWPIRGYEGHPEDAA